MDTLSHAVIGFAVAGLSGHPVSFTDPVYLAAAFGSQAPDLDIIAHLRGNFSYIRQHRSFSHSILGVCLWSAVISTLLFYLFPETAFSTLLFWSFAGAFSHVLTDYFNTHGAAIFWPFQRKRKSVQLLNVFDPILITAMLSVYAWEAPIRHQSFAALTVLFLYILLRALLRKRTSTWIQQAFYKEKMIQLAVMPSLKRILFWDFVLLTENRYIVGQIGALYPVLEVHADLPKPSALSELAIEAQKTFIGDFFTSFSPYVYFEERTTSNCLLVNIYDLRYMLNQQFLHRATVFFDHNKKPIVSIMHSYGKTVKLPC